MSHLVEWFKIAEMREGDDKVAAVNKLSDHALMKMKDSVPMIKKELDKRYFDIK